MTFILALTMVPMGVTMTESILAAAVWFPVALQLHPRRGTSE